MKNHLQEFLVGHPAESVKEPRGLRASEKCADLTRQGHAPNARGKLKGCALVSNAKVFEKLCSFLPCPTSHMEAGSDKTGSRCHKSTSDLNFCSARGVGPDVATLGRVVERARGPTPR